jgi:hypothetical protein
MVDYGMGDSLPHDSLFPPPPLSLQVTATGAIISRCALKLAKNN